MCLLFCIIAHFSKRRPKKRERAKRGTSLTSYMYTVHVRIYNYSSIALVLHTYNYACIYMYIIHVQ